MRALPAEPETTGPDRPNRDTIGTSARRLDSWKAVAQYLGRDERTVRRWEKESGLPIHRVPGGRGASVFAYESEIDAWLRLASTPKASTAPVAAVVPAPLAPVPARTWSTARLAAIALVVCGATAAIALLAFRREEPLSALSIRLTPDAVVAVGRDGAERWHYAVPALPEKTIWDPAPQVVTTGRPAVYVASAYREKPGNNENVSGQLMELDARGRLRNLFEFKDRLVFGAGGYAAPWAISDVRVDDRGPFRRVALAAHHMQWWPSIVTILDDQSRRLGTFVNSGFVTQLLWLDRDRLLASGYSNAHEGAMLAMLDATALDGKSPAGLDSAFDCLSCRESYPMVYVVFGRSELNRLSGSQFNSARMEIRGDRIIVRTTEMPWDGRSTAAEALYELSPALELLSAAYSDRYWDEHRRLEAQGVLHHTADACPERTPSKIRAYRPGAGWRDLRATF